MRPIALIAFAAAVLLILSVPAETARGQGMMPHAVIGRVTGPGGEGAGGAAVTLENARTGDQVTATANATGWYQTDLSPMPGGLQTGDVIRVRAVAGELEGISSFAVTGNPFDVCNVTISEKVGSMDLIAIGIVALIGVVAAIAVAAMLLRDRSRKEPADKGRRRR